MSLTPHPPPPPLQYWCHHCNKRVPIETLPDHPDVICCFECKNGFVESIAVSVSVSSRASDEEEEEDGPPFGGEFLHILRLIALAAREDDEPPPPPPDGRLEGGGSDYLRIELDGWSNNGSGLSVDHVDHDQDDDVDNQDDDVDDGEDAHDRNEGVGDDGSNNNNNNNNNNDDDDDGGDDGGDEDGDDGNEDEMVRRRDVLRLQLRDFASRATSRRNRILDWAEILMGLEDESVEFRLRVSGGGGGDHGYVGDPGDYVDAAGYEALLNTLAESDGGGRRGAPPAAKTAVEGLRTVEVDSGETEVCAICKDGVFNNEGKVVKELECGHMYHGECIVAWLDSKNSCPVCRFELPTDDPEYEEDRKKRLEKVTVVGIDHGCSSTSRGAD